MSEMTSFKFGPTIIARVRDAADLREVLSDSWFNSPTMEYAPLNRAPLELAAKEFGSADTKAILVAARLVGDWFALPYPKAVI